MTIVHVLCTIVLQHDNTLTHTPEAMKTYTITAGCIEDTYTAESAEDALEQYASEAGYSSYADLVEQHGEAEVVSEQ